MSVTIPSDGAVIKTYRQFTTEFDVTRDERLDLADDANIDLVETKDSGLVPPKDATSEQLDAAIERTVLNPIQKVLEQRDGQYILIPDRLATRIYLTKSLEQSPQP